MSIADLILHNGKITTNSAPSEVAAVAIGGGRVLASGTDADAFKLRVGWNGPTANRWMSLPCGTVS